MTTMTASRLAADESAMSESVGVAVLIGLTILVTAMVGLNVLVLDSDGSDQVRANFTYDYVEESEALIVTHAEGDAIPAGQLEFQGDTAKATWAELSGRNASATVEPGDVVQLGENGAYGTPIDSRTTVEVYLNRSGNRTKLDEWRGGTS